MSHLDYDPLYLNGLYDGGSYQQSIQQLQDKLATEGCCISKPNTFQMGINYKYLSDIIKTFGDLGVRSLAATQEYGCIPILAIEADMYAKRPESTVSEC